MHARHWHRRRDDLGKVLWAGLIKLDPYDPVKLGALRCYGTWGSGHVLRAGIVPYKSE